jgi:hypothetical protein
LDHFSKLGLEQRDSHERLRFCSLEPLLCRRSLARSHDVNGGEIEIVDDSVFAIRGAPDHEVTASTGSDVLTDPTASTGTGLPAASVGLELLSSL